MSASADHQNVIKITGPTWRWWLLDAACADALASGSGAFDLDALDSATVVKENALRHVHRVVTADGTFFVKVHRQCGFASRLKFAIMGGGAKDEYRVSRYAAAHSVPAVRIVARAERIDSWQPHLSATVSKAIDHAESLADAFHAIRKILDNATRRSATRALSGAVAHLLAVAHDNAFLHPDTHPGNILVQTEQTGEYACYYVDLQGARCGREVCEAEAARNLAALNQWFASRVGRTDRLRFLKTYAELRKQWRSRAAFRRFAQQIERAAQWHAQKLYRKRDRRIGRKNAYFGRIHLPGGGSSGSGGGAQAHVTLRLRASHISGESDGALRTLDDWQTFFEKGDQPNACAPACDNANACTNEMAETFFPGRRGTGVFGRLAGSPAWRRYRTACLAMNRDLPTVAGLAHWTRGSRWSVQEAHWKMRSPRDSQPLLRVLEKAKGRQRATILEAVGCLIADTAARGLALRELSATRIEVVRRSNDKPIGYWVYWVYWAGVEGIALRRPAKPYIRDWMLGQLLYSITSVPHVSHADRSRVLRACLQRAEGSTANWKACWHQMANLFP